MTDATSEARATSHWRDEIGTMGRIPHEWLSEFADRINPDGIPIGQRPTKPCDHDFNFLRTDHCVVDQKDVFFCRRCLEYRDVKR